MFIDFSPSHPAETLASFSNYPLLPGLSAGETAKLACEGSEYLAAFCDP
jgi:hypothetical protein